MCVSAVPSFNSTLIHTHGLHIYFSSRYYGKCLPVKSANEMYIHKLHYKTSNITVLTKCTVWESTWINTSWLSGFVYVCRCFCVLHSLSQSAQFTEFHIHTLNFLSFISRLMKCIELTLCSGCGHQIHQHLATLDKRFPIYRVLKHTKLRLVMSSMIHCK